MSFKKLHPIIKNVLESKNILSYAPIQKKIIPFIKSGSSVYGIGPKGSGKTTALIMGVLQKLKCEAVEDEDSPRAIIVVKDKQATWDLAERFEEFTKHTNLRVYKAYQEFDLEKQREQVYHGVDILIVTPKRLNKLYYQNSLHMGEMLLFCVYDADFLNRNEYHNDVLRMSESVSSKCKFVIMSETYNKKIANYQEAFMYNSAYVEVKKVIEIPEVIIEPNTDSEA